MKVLNPSRLRVNVTLGQIAVCVTLLATGFGAWWNQKQAVSTNAERQSALSTEIKEVKMSVQDKGQTISVIPVMQKDIEYIQRDISKMQLDIADIKKSIDAKPRVARF